MEVMENLDFDVFKSQVTEYCKRPVGLQALLVFLSPPLQDLRDENCWFNCCV